MIPLGWFLFCFGILASFGSGLQAFTLGIAIFNLVIILSGASLLFLAEWRGIKSENKRISSIAVLCFLFGFLSYFLNFATEIDKWNFIASIVLPLSLSLFSIISGIIFSKIRKENKGVLVGQSMAKTGIVLSVISSILTISLFLITPKII